MEIYIAFIFIMTFITLAFYAADKKKAEKNKWRVKEKTLLLLSLCGGSIGGMIALFGLRHKNRHWYFVAVNIISLIIHLCLGYVLFNIVGFMFI